MDLCVDTPSQDYRGQELFPTLYKKAAAMLVNISKLHAFVESNKRTALLAVETFLQINGIDVILPLKATRYTVDVTKTEKDVDKLINEASNFLEVNSLNKNDVNGSILKIKWLLGEIDEFTRMSEDLQLSLLRHWLVYEIYPENEETSKDIIVEYISNLYTTMTVFMDKVEKNLTQ